MSHRTLVLTSSLVLVALAGLLPGSPVSAQDGGAAPPVAPAVGEKVKLAVAFVKGSRLGYEQNVDMEMNINAGGMEMPMVIDLNSTWVDTCEAVDEAGVGTVRSKFVRVHGNFSNPMMGEFPFDSDKPADDSNPMAGQITAQFTALAKAEVESKIGADGGVIAVKSSGMAGMPELSVDDVAKQMGSLGKFPKDAVGVGDSWSAESTIKAGMGLTLKTKMKYTIKAIDADAITLSAEGELSKIPGGGATSDDPQQAMAMQMMEKLTIDSNKLSGTTRLSRKDGRVLSAESDVAVKMSVPESEGGGMAIDQKIKMKISRLAKVPEPAKTEGAKAPETPAPAQPAGPGAK